MADCPRSHLLSRFVGLPVADVKVLNPPEYLCAGRPVASGEVCGAVEAQVLQKEINFDRDFCSPSLTSRFIHLSSVSDHLRQPLFGLEDATDPQESSHRFRLACHHWRRLQCG